jgi:hypothetical protein
MEMGWRWDGDGMELGWRWDGDGMEMGWRWDGDGMEMGATLGCFGARQHLGGECVARMHQELRRCGVTHH